MNIKHAVGHWSAGDFCDRFAPPGYHSDDPSFSNTSKRQCRRTKAAGVDAIEIHQSVFEKTAERRPRSGRRSSARRTGSWTSSG